jgi:hypothetical protein
LNTVDPQLESAWFHKVCCFKCNLYRYILDSEDAATLSSRFAAEVRALPVVRECNTHEWIKSKLPPPAAPTRVVVEDRLGGGGGGGGKGGGGGGGAVQVDPYHSKAPGFNP